MVAYPRVLKMRFLCFECLKLQNFPGDAPLNPLGWGLHRPLSCSPTALRAVGLVKKILTVGKSHYLVTPPPPPLKKCLDTRLIIAPFIRTFYSGSGRKLSLVSRLTNDILVRKMYKNAMYKVQKYKCII